MSKKSMLLTVLTTGLMFGGLGFGGCGTWEWLAVGAGAIVVLGSGVLSTVLGTGT